ncbi:hypothetical protein CWI36_0314p0030 [Hamiltosporidium magnivora]|uniref:Leucine-rich repeat-containing protein n=1 Tax=Hamiltosporidium magnivora TaxID=148818 RepID=A0A4V6MVH1_9MICR|nr:hypothetical protein CWI36_0314p0030 [Hamiltosporidium magnivora]
MVVSDINEERVVNIVLIFFLKAWWYKNLKNMYLYKAFRLHYLIYNILENSINCTLHRINIVYVSKNELKLEEFEKYKSIESNLKQSVYLNNSFTNLRVKALEIIYKKNLDKYKELNKIEKCKIIIDYPHQCILKFKTFNTFLNSKTKSFNLYLDELDNGSLNIFIKSLSRIDYFVNNIKPKLFYSILFWLQCFNVIRNKYFEIYLMGLFNNSLMGQYSNEYRTFNYKKFYFGGKLKPVITNLVFTCFLQVYLLGLKDLNIFYFFDQDNNASINNDLFANLVLQFKNKNLASILKYWVEKKSFHFIEHYIARIYIKRIEIGKLTSDISDDRLLIFIEYFLLKIKEIELIIDENNVKILELIKCKRIMLLKTKILSISNINIKDIFILLQFPKLEHIFLKVEVNSDKNHMVFDGRNTSQLRFFKDIFLFSNQKIIDKIFEIFVELLKCKDLKVIIRKEIGLFEAKILGAINFIDSNLEYKKGNHLFDLTDTNIYSKIISLDTIMIKYWNPRYKSFINIFDYQEIQNLNVFRSQLCVFLYTEIISLFKHPKIKKIILNDCTILKSKDKIKTEDFENSALETLKTQNTGFSKHFIRLLSGFINLKTLSLDSFIKKTEDINILKDIKFPKTLETLDLKNNNFEVLNERVRFQCQNLKIINLSNTDIPKDSLFYLISFKDSIESFYYSHNRIHSSDFNLFCQMTNLSCLFIPHSTFKNITFSDLIVQKHLTTIKVLNLSHTTLYPQDLFKISLIQTLEHLNLFSCRFKNHSKFFFEPNKLPKLIYLNIEINYFTDSEIQSLKETTNQNVLHLS